MNRYRLREIVRKAIELYDSMSDEQKNDMLIKQRDNYVTTELELPRLEMLKTRMVK